MHTLLTVLYGAMRGSVRLYTQTRGGLYGETCTLGRNWGRETHSSARVRIVLIASWSFLSAWNGIFGSD